MCFKASEVPLPSGLVAAATVRCPVGGGNATLMKAVAEHDLSDMAD